MGELFMIPGRQMGILGTSKGDSYARGGGDPAPAVVPMDPAKTVAVLDAINTINAGDGPPRRMTATGETLPSSKPVATLPRRFTPEPPPAPDKPINNMPLPWWKKPSWLPVPTGVIPVVVPGQAIDGGGGGGGGGAAPGTGPGPDDQVAAEPAVFLGLTMKQLAIGGALLVGGYLLLRKKKHGGGSIVEGVI